MSARHRTTALAVVEPAPEPAEESSAEEADRLADELVADEAGLARSERRFVLRTERLEDKRSALTGKRRAVDDARHRAETEAAERAAEAQARGVLGELLPVYAERTAQDAQAGDQLAQVRAQRDRAAALLAEAETVMDATAIVDLEAFLVARRRRDELIGAMGDLDHLIGVATDARAGLRLEVLKAEVCSAWDDLAFYVVLRDDDPSAPPPVRERLEVRRAEEQARREREEAKRAAEAIVRALGEKAALELAESARIAEKQRLEETGRMREWDRL